MGHVFGLGVYQAPGDDSLFPCLPFLGRTLNPLLEGEIVKTSLTEFLVCAEGALDGGMNDFFSRSRG